MQIIKQPNETKSLEGTFIKANSGVNNKHLNKL